MKNEVDILLTESHHHICKNLVDLISLKEAESYRIKICNQFPHDNRDSVLLPLELGLDFVSTVQEIKGRLYTFRQYLTSTM